jgi:RNA polymerase sigma-70 factor (ECF subfamily)
MPRRKSDIERKNKEAALAALYDEYYDRIARYVYVRLGDRGEAEDIAGEVFLKALESLDSYKEQGFPMQAWLFKIAHNLAVDHLRKMSKRKTLPIDGVIVKDDMDPQAVAETHIELARVNKAIEQLTLAQQQVIQLRFFGELSSEETAEVMNRSGGAVRELQSAAIKSLRKVLDQETPSKEGE